MVGDLINFLFNIPIANIVDVRNSILGGRGQNHALMAAPLKRVPTAATATGPLIKTLPLRFEAVEKIANRAVPFARSTAW